MYDSDYLTLKKIGWSSRRDTNTFANNNVTTNLNTSTNNSRAWKMIDDEIEDQRPSENIFE